ncbi:MAG TPA: hypothetical protein VFB52_07145 [Solirubrobacterales bacterium]|nr:hypothetical protein [Solirubrobacterales bacterium]
MVAALVLSACGDGEEGDAAQIEATITASATSRDPADCRRYRTQRMLEQATKVRGEVAIEACEETMLEDWERPTSVEVTRIEVDGDEATAQVATVGGVYSEQEVLIALVEEDGTWMEDEFLGFAVFDREAFLLEFGREIMERARTRAHANANACVVGLMEQLSDAEIEAVLVDPSPQVFEDFVRPCEPRSARA